MVNRQMQMAVQNTQVTAQTMSTHSYKNYLNKRPENFKNDHSSDSVPGE